MISGLSTLAIAQKTSGPLFDRLQDAAMGQKEREAFETKVLALQDAIFQLKLRRQPNLTLVELGAIATEILQIGEN